MWRSQVWHEPASFRSDPINRRRRCDVERVIVLVAPYQIGRLLGHYDRSKVMALRIPNPDPLRPDNEEIAAFIESHAIGNAARFVLIAENAFIGQSCRRRKIKSPDVFL